MADPLPLGSRPPRGRDAVLESLAREFEQPLARYFQRRATNKSDVPDLVQEVFVGLSRMKDPGSIEKPETFLFVTAANVLRDRHRRDTTHHAVAHQAFDDDTDPGSGFSPERVLEGRDRIALIRASLFDLPARTRDVFVLKAFEDLSMREIAVAFGVSTRAVEKHYAKALAHVTRSLEESDHSHRG